MAEPINVSVNQLDHWFTVILRRSPENWLKEVCVWDAARLLTEGGSSAGTAAMLGFHTVLEFAQQFETYHGFPPENFTAENDLWKFYWHTEWEPPAVRPR